MLHTSLTGTLILLSASLAPMILTTTTSAQGTSFPPGLEAKDARHYSNYLGRYRDMRFQALYGGLQGSNKVFTFSSLELRRETTSGFTNFGRTWSDVKLHVGDHDYTKLSDTFASNLRSPTMVFSGSVSWPTTVGKPTVSPAPWGNFVSANDMKFPFGTGGAASSFLHDGKMGFGVEFEMAGGTLENSAAWASTTGISYYHDGFATNNQSSGGVFSLTKPSKAGCTSAYFATWLFSDRTVGGVGSQFRGQLFMYGGEPNKAHVGVMGIENFLTTPISFLATCNKLWLNVSLPVVQFNYVTDSRGEYYSPFITSKYRPRAVGLRVDTQAAFEDSRGRLQLTRAARTPMTAIPTGTPVYYASRLYRFGGTDPLAETIGFGPYNTRVPIIRMR